MAKALDLYSVAESARVLGLSPKRVRQLIDEGRLQKRADNPVRVAQSEVIALRKEREVSGATPRPVSASAPVSDIGEQLARILADINENNRRAITALEHASEIKETAYLEQIAYLKSEVEALRQAPRRGLFRR